MLVNIVSITSTAPASPVTPFEGAAVFRVIIELGHARFKSLSDWTVLQEGQRQLVLRVHKRLRGREWCINSAVLIRSGLNAGLCLSSGLGGETRLWESKGEGSGGGIYLCFLAVRILQPAVRVRNLLSMVIVHLRTHRHIHWKTFHTTSCFLERK